MKSLSIERMESFQGGDTCTTTANVIGSIALGLTFAAFFINPVTAPVAATFVASQGAALGTVAVGMGWMCD